MLIIIEIKGTDWDKIRADRVKRNVQRHIRQLLAYLDTAIGELEAGQWEGVAGALLYPSRPASAESLACIEAATAEQAIMLTWYDEVPWRPLPHPNPGPPRHLSGAISGRYRHLPKPNHRVSLCSFPGFQKADTEA